MAVVSVKQYEFAILDERLKAIIVCVKEEPSISARKMSEKLNIFISTVEMHLKKMSDSGVIKREGNTRSAVWIVIVGDFRSPPHHPHITLTLPSL